MNPTVLEKIKASTYLHILLYGRPGTGKDTLAATFKPPIIVLHLDGFGNDFPYMQNATDMTDIQTYEFGLDPATEEPLLIHYRDITTPDGPIRIENHSSPDLEEPVTAGIIEARMRALHKEDWNTVVLGSLTALNVEAVAFAQQYVLPNAKEPRQWRAWAADLIERLVFAQAGLKKNVLFLAHTHEKQSIDDMGAILTPLLPGRLASGAGGQFGEIWRTCMGKGENGVEYMVQTQADGQYQAKTHINAPNYLVNPTYDKLWADFGK